MAYSARSRSPIHPINSTSSSTSNLNANPSNPNGSTLMTSNPSSMSSRSNQTIYSQVLDQLQDLLSQKEVSERIIDGAQGLLSLVEAGSTAAPAGNGMNVEDNSGIMSLLNSGMDYSAIKIEFQKELINAQNRLEGILEEIERAREKLAIPPSPSASVQSDLAPQHPFSSGQHSPYASSALGLQGTQGAGPSLISLNSSGTSTSADSPASHNEVLESGSHQSSGGVAYSGESGGRGGAVSNGMRTNGSGSGSGGFKNRDQEAIMLESNQIANEIEKESEKARESTREARSQAVNLIRILGKLMNESSRPNSWNGGNNINASNSNISNQNSNTLSSNRVTSTSSKPNLTSTNSTPFSWTNQNPSNSNDLNQNTKGNGNQVLGMPPPNLPSMTRTAQRTRAARVIGSQTPSHTRTPSNASGLGELQKRRLEIMNRLTVVLDKNLRGRYELPIDELLDSVLPCLSDNAGKECRAAAYRLLRYALVRPPWPLICRLRSRGLDYYLTRTFLRDNRFELEKEAALKLVRAVMETGAASALEPQPQQIESEAPLEGLIGEGTIRALVSLREHPEEKLRHLCLETLAELAIFDLRLLIRGGGMRTVLQSLNDGPPELAPVLVQAFLHLVDMPSTREYLRPGVDLEVALAGFTDAPAIKDLHYEESLRTTSQVVSVMLRSWSGLLYLCMNGKQAIGSVILALRINASDVRNSILDMFYEIFRVHSDSSASFTPTPNSGKDGKNVNQEETGEVVGSRASCGRLNMINQYLALLLLICIDVGLIDALVHVVATAEQSRKATLLLGEILHLSNRVLPRLHGAQMYTLPQLFTLASNFQAGDRGRQTATSALSSIDGMDRQRTRQDHTKSSLIRQGTLLSVGGMKANSNRDRSGSAEERARTQRTEIGRSRPAVQIDDQAFRLLLIETQVLNTKDHTKWNYDMLMEMLEGPLLNPKRLEEAMRGSKFVRRLLSFFHPFQLRFSSIRMSKDNRKYIRLGCVLINTLLASPDGVRFLSEDKFLKELRECLDQLNPITNSGINISEPLMSKGRISETLTVGYFEMIGTLTSSNEGLRLLESFKIFTRIYHLVELRSRDDLIKEVVENFDVSIDGHSRIILSKTLTSTNQSIRIFATKHLEDLITMTSYSVSASSSISTSNFQHILDVEWMISLLLTQLYDVSIEVRRLAVRIVEEACTSSKNLEIVVSMRPTLDHLGEMGHPMLLKFLSTPVGFKYLWEGGYVDREMEDWFNVRNLRYTVQLEVLLAKSLSLPTSTSSSNPKTKEEFDGTVPPHFYGILTKTSQGCQILEEKGHLREFSQFIRQHGMEFRDAEVINKLKSVLWAVGNIASSARGLTFLEADDLLSSIVEIAEASLVLSVRGTCFFVLGLVSSTQEGMELLEEYGWHSVCCPLGTPMGLCIPSEIDRFVGIPTWTPRTSPSVRYLSSAPPPVGVERSILTSISNLGNSILAARAQRSLTKLKESHRAAFSSPSLIVRAFAILDGFALRAPVRRYIWELFDLKLDECTVGKLREEKKKLQAKGRNLNSTSKSSTAGNASAFNSVQEDRNIDGGTRRTKWAEVEAEAAADLAFARIRKKELDAGLEPGVGSFNLGEIEDLESEEEEENEEAEEDEEELEEAFSEDGDVGMRPLDLDEVITGKPLAGMNGDSSINSSNANITRDESFKVSRALPYNTAASKIDEVQKQVLDPKTKVVGGFGELGERRADGSMVDPI